MKNILKLIFGLIVLIVVIATCGCTKAQPNADEEGVLVMKPWIWGHGGVDDKPISAGLTWCAPTTDVVYFKVVPTRYDVTFDDIFSNDNTPLDYATYLNIEIERGKTPILLKNYGENWFKNNIETEYRKFVRDEVSKYSPFDLMSNREVCLKVDSAVYTKTIKFIEELSQKKEFPINVISVVTGRAKPNEKQLKEMDNTASAIQEKVTQDRKAEMYESKKIAEQKRADADKAYMEQLNLSTDQFLMLKMIEKGNPNIDIVMGSGMQSMWNIRR